MEFTHDRLPATLEMHASPHRQARLIIPQPSKRTCLKNDVVDHCVPLRPLVPYFPCAPLVYAGRMHSTRTTRACR